MTLLQTDFLPNKSETFQAFRYLLQQSNLQPGVVSSGDFAATQRGAGANMSVDVAAGDAWVLGAGTTRQGLYHQTNDAALNAVVTAADGTNPRIDQVFLVVNDSAISGASDTPALVVVAGTPTSGATLDNRTGAATSSTVAATYPNRLLLADILVPASSTSVVTANIRDRRPWARGNLGSYTRTVTDLSTSSATLVNTDAVNWLFRLECSGVPVRVTLDCVLADSAATETFGLVIDGAASIDRVIRLSSAAQESHSINWWPQLAAGSHLFQLQWKTAGGGTLTMAAANQPTFTVEEVVRKNANNGTT